MTHPKSKMYYQNFDDHITCVYRIVIEGWLLPKFASLSNIGSLTEVQLLYESWKSGATCFRRLTDNEWKEWLERAVASQTEEVVGMEARELATMAGEGGGISSGDRLHTGSTLAPWQVSRNSAIHGLAIAGDPHGANRWPFTDFVNTVTSSNGQPVLAQKKGRKPHSDKGKLRGPWKNVPVATTHAMSSQVLPS
jgi:hypothetical protein